MEINKERDQLLEKLRSTLLASSNKQICELLKYWFDLLIGEDAIEELLDDCCQLLDYHIMSATTGQSYQTYTAWREIEDKGAAEEKLPTLTTRYFHKGGHDIEYPVYDRRMLFSPSQRGKIEQWREEHNAHVHENRKVAAKAAAETRRATDKRLSKWGPLF